MVELCYRQDRISKFYEEGVDGRGEGNIEDSLGELESEEIRFRGKDIGSIKKSEQSYSKGVGEMKKVDLNVNLGG